MPLPAPDDDPAVPPPPLAALPEPFPPVAVPPMLEGEVLELLDPPPLCAALGAGDDELDEELDGGTLMVVLLDDEGAGL